MKIPKPLEKNLKQKKEGNEDLNQKENMLKRYCAHCEKLDIKYMIYHSNLVVGRIKYVHRFSPIKF